MKTTDKVKKLDIEQQRLFWQVVESRRKQTWIAFMLCLFFGPFGAHKFYLGQYLFGTIILVLTILFCLFPPLLLIPLIMSVAECFFVGVEVRRRNDQNEDDVYYDIVRE